MLSTGETTAALHLKSALIVDPDSRSRQQLQQELQKHFGLVESTSAAESAFGLCRRCHFDLVIADLQLPVTDVRGWVDGLRALGTQAEFILVTAEADQESLLAALWAGAADVISRPIEVGEVLKSVNRSLQGSRGAKEVRAIPPPSSCDPDQSGFVGESERIKSLCEVLRRVAPMPSTVMIEGESGTGKELAARAIHQWSGRGGAFVPVNCGAISAELIESELFGHQKGAFTGAHQARQGLFVYAEGGTLFLDEIGEMPLPMQAHLLRVLEERTIRPVGSNRETPVDVRIVAATNRNLAVEVKEGNFREDLYFRLNVLSIRMPALRETKDDIVVLASHFLDSIAHELGVQPPQLQESDFHYLRSHHWPGNVRELKNVIERCLLLNDKPSQCLGGHVAAAATAVEERGEHDVALATVEKRHILKVLEMEAGNKSAAARRLGIARKTLERKLQSWNRE
jgi:DNA-binding NtrC family response regulator